MEWVSRVLSYDAPLRLNEMESRIQELTEFTTARTQQESGLGNGFLVKDRREGGRTQTEVG